MTTLNLTIEATTTKSFNKLTAIHQILLGYTNAPLVLEFFPYGWDNIGNFKVEHLMNCFKKLNDAKS